MDNEGNWRSVGANDVMNFISSAREDQHDVVVYDSGYEFDPDNPQAVRFIASVVIQKSLKNGELFTAEIPTDGSVCQRDTEPCKQSMRYDYLRRKGKENYAEAHPNAITYVPDSYEYCMMLERAEYHLLEHPYDAMTPEERRVFGKKEKRWKRRKLFEQICVKLCIAGAIILPIITLIYLLS